MKASEYLSWVEEHKAEEVAGPAYCLNLFVLAESCKAQRVLELGHGWGWSATAFAASIENRVGEIICIDVVDRRKKECVDFLWNISVKYVFQKSSIRSVFTEGEFDLIYMDASPTLEDIFCDYEQFYRFLKPNGLLIVDGLFGQIGPTSFIKKSKLDWLPMQYSEKYAHGVHRKKPWPEIKIGKNVKCYACDWGMKSLDPALLDSSAMSHIQSTGHAEVHSWAEQGKPIYSWVRRA